MILGRGNPSARVAGTGYTVVPELEGAEVVASLVLMEDLAVEGRARDLGRSMAVEGVKFRV